LKTASLSIPALIVLSLIAPDCRPREPGWAGRIENVDGVTVVHNPVRPKTEDRVLVLEEELSIGQEGGGPEYLFSGIGGLAVDTAGAIYAIDTREAAVRVFDKNGVYLRTIGRKGQGPGETQYPVFVQVVAPGELAVYDYSAARMLFYSLDGVYLRQKMTSRAVLPIGLDSEGRLIAQYILAPPPKGGKVLMRFDPDYGSDQELAREDMGPDRVFDIGRPSCYAALSPDDTIIWGDSREYQLYMLSPEGKLLKRIVKETRPRAITEAERDGYRNKYADALKFGMQLSFRARFPEFSGVFFDDKGRLFVRTYERAAGSPDSFTYDVFAPDGVYESKVAVPATLDRISVWKDGRIYTVESDEGGLPLIKRHKVVWKRGAPAS
jgi:hypothetical protein